MAVRMEMSMVPHVWLLNHTHTLAHTQESIGAVGTIAPTSAFSAELLSSVSQMMAQAGMYALFVMPTQLLGVRPPNDERIVVRKRRGHALHACMCVYVCMYVCMYV
jgi:hypothetical protein